MSIIVSDALYIHSTTQLIHFRGFKVKADFSSQWIYK